MSKESLASWSIDKDTYRFWGFLLGQLVHFCRTWGCSMLGIRLGCQGRVHRRLGEIVISVIYALHGPLVANDILKVVAEDTGNGESALLATARRHGSAIPVEHSRVLLSGRLCPTTWAGTGLQ